MCAAVALGCDAKTEPAPAVADGEAGAKAKGDTPAAEAKPSLPDAATLLADSVVAVGGKERLTSIQDFHLKGKISAAAQNLNGEVETWWKDGDFYMVQTIPGLGINRSGKKGDVIWAEEPINGLRRLEGKEAEQHTWASSLNLAADWDRYFAKAETIGEREVDGKKAYDIELSADSGAKLTFTIDAQSKLMIEQSFAVESPLGAMPVAIRSLDYRDVDGMKIPHKQVTDAGVMKLTQELTVVELNTGVPTESFGMPTGDAPVVEAKPTAAEGTPNAGAAAGAKDADAPQAPQAPDAEKMKKAG